MTIIHLAVLFQEITQLLQEKARPDQTAFSFSSKYVQHTHHKTGLTGMTDLHSNQPRIIQFSYFKASPNKTLEATQLAEKQSNVEYFDVLEDDEERDEINAH